MGKKINPKSTKKSQIQPLTTPPVPVCKNWPKSSRHLQMNQPGSPSWGKIPEKAAGCQSKKRMPEVEQERGKKRRFKRPELFSCSYMVLLCHQQLPRSMTNEAQLGSTLAYPVIFSFFQPPARCACPVLFELLSLHSQWLSRAGRSGISHP